MSVETLPNPVLLPQSLRGQMVVVLGESVGIGLETARLARARGADVVLAGGNPVRLRDTARAIDAAHFEAFDLADLTRLERFFHELAGPIDHVLLTCGGSYHSRLADMDFERARRDLNERILVTLAVARYGAARMRPPGTLLFLGGTGGRRIAVGNTLISAMVAALPPLVANLAAELAPIRVNLIAPDSVDTQDVAALAVHLMVDATLSGMAFDVGGGRQRLSSRTRIR